MAADYWRSSQCHNWTFTHEQLVLARTEDLRYANPLELAAIGIWIGNTLSNLCKRLGLRQRVTATATVFARRFYAKNAYAATEPCLVCAGCVYVAAKVEEMPIHIKQVVTEAMRMFAEMSAGKFAFPSDRAVLAEMEFYLIEDLEFDLIIHHPYRALVAIYDAIGKDSKKAGTGTAGGSGGGAARGGGAGTGASVGLDPVDSPASDLFHAASVPPGDEIGSVPPRAGGPGAHGTHGIEGLGVRGAALGTSEWATRPKAPDPLTMALQEELKVNMVGKIPYKLDIFDERVFQMAWPILNDVYRTEIPLLYPPYLIALGAICLALVVQEEAFQKLQHGHISIDLASTPRDGIFSLSSAPISVERVQKFEREGREVVEEAEMRRRAVEERRGGGVVGSTGAGRTTSPPGPSSRRGLVGTGAIGNNMTTTSSASNRAGLPTSRSTSLMGRPPPFSPAHHAPHAHSPLADVSSSHATPAPAPGASLGAGAGAGSVTGGGGANSSAPPRRALHHQGQGHGGPPSSFAYQHHSAASASATLPPRPGHLPSRPPSGGHGHGHGHGYGLGQGYTGTTHAGGASSSLYEVGGVGRTPALAAAGLDSPAPLGGPGGGGGGGLMTPPALPSHLHRGGVAGVGAGGMGRAPNPGGGGSATTTSTTTANPNPSSKALRNPTPPPPAPPAPATAPAPPQARANPLGPPTDPPPHPLVLLLATLNIGGGVPTLARVVQDMVRGYEVWHAARALVDDGRAVLLLLEGMRERRGVVVQAQAAQAAQGQGGQGGGSTGEPSSAGSSGGGTKRAREG